MLVREVRMSTTQRVLALVRDHLRAPDELAARLTLQSIALEVARLEAGEARAFELAMDALGRERSGLEVVK